MNDKNIKMKNNIFNLENVYTIVSIVYVGMIILYIGTFFTDRPRFGIIFFGVSMIIFILRALRKEFVIFKKIINLLWVRVIAIVIIFLVIFITYYYWKEFYFLIYERCGSSNLLDKILGAINLILLFLAVYSFSGLPIAGVSLFFVFYSLFGNYFPGILRFKGFTVGQLVEITSVQILRGIHGDLLQISATLVAIFIIFAAFAKSLGAFDIIMRISLLIARHSKYLVAQSAVLASAVMGMFTGSGAANVAGTGSFTIPLMKKYKIPSYIAGAIEAVASAGGQIMPPIMGAAAFLMADYLGVPYIKIAIVAILPAILYFAGVSFSVHNISQLVKIEIPNDMKTKNNTEVKKTKKEERLSWFLTGALPLFSSLILLIVLMTVVKLEAMLAGYYTTIFLIVFAFLQKGIGILKNKKMYLKYIKQFIGSMIKGVKEAVNPIMEIGLMLSLMGVILVILSTSGLASKVNFLLLSMSKGQLVPLLILSAIISILLGCVVSTVAVYVLAVITVAPALLRVGIDPLIVHFYIFWFAILGLITPPVAGNVVAACRIAGSNFLSTAFEAMKIGVGLLIIPIIMVVHPSLLIFDNKTIIVFFMGLIVLYAFSLSFYGGYIIKGKFGKFIRLIIGILGLIVIIMPLRLEYISYIITLVLLIYFIFIKLNKGGN